jgi:DNA-binding PadR family transcriptional regulator
MKERKVSLLSYALLGLIHGRPCSGYDLRKIFATTPMGSFSDSPGAIYPALRRLEKDGMVRGQVTRSAGLRVRQVFRLTPRGTSALNAWLKAPVTRDDVIHRMADLALRFAFMDMVAGPAASIAFLKSLEKELASYVPSLQEYLDREKQKMPLSAQLAMLSGVRGYEANLRWTREALAAYQRKQ